MDDDEMPEQDLTGSVRTFALTATAEFLLLIGIVFFLLGIADFLTDYIKIKGSGEAIVGVALVAIAFILLVRMRPRVALVQKPPPAEEVKDSGDYR